MPVTQIDYIYRNLKKVSFTYKGKEYKGRKIYWRKKDPKHVGAFVQVDGKLVELII